MQALEKNTVALGMRIEKKLFDLFISDFPYRVLGRSKQVLSFRHQKPFINVLVFPDIIGISLSGCGKAKAFILG